MPRTFILFWVFLPILINSQCSPGSTYYNDKCYTFFPVQVDFKTAESICIVSNGHLASVHNTIDSNFIAQQAQKYGSVNTSIWLGARSYSSSLNDPSSWNWTDGTPFDYQNYQSGQPKTLETQACMNLLAANGKWSTAKYFSCPSGYYFLESTQSCYKLVIARVTWTAGQSVCNSEGGHLASVHSGYENDFLTDISKTGLSVNKHLSISIGATVYGNDGCNRNEWYWTDGTSYNYANWANGEPNNCKKELWDSIMPDPIDGNYNPYGGEWNNVENTQNRGYICKQPMRRS